MKLGGIPHLLVRISFIAAVNIVSENIFFKIEYAILLQYNLDACTNTLLSNYPTMRTGFFVSSQSTQTPGEPTPTMQETVDSLKGKKKKELKAIVAVRTGQVNDLTRENKKLAEELKAASEKLKVAEEKLAKTILSAKSEINRSIYYENLDIVRALSKEPYSYKWQLEFCEKYISVKFGIHEDKSGKQTGYGAWIRDAAIGKRYLVCPWYGDAGHTHLKDVPCGGVQVEGVVEVLNLLINWSNRKEEFISGLFPVHLNILAAQETCLTH